MRDKQEIEKIVKGYSGSGLSVEAYCRKVGIRSNRFYYWRKALRDERSERFVEVAGTEALAEVNIAGNVMVKVAVSEVAGLIRSLGCLP